MPAHQRSGRDERQDAARITAWGGAPHGRRRPAAWRAHHRPSPIRRAAHRRPHRSGMARARSRSPGCPALPARPPAQCPPDAPWPAPLIRKPLKLCGFSAVQAVARHSRPSSRLPAALVRRGGLGSFRDSTMAVIDMVLAVARTAQLCRPLYGKCSINVSMQNGGALAWRWLCRSVTCSEIDSPTHDNICDYHSHRTRCDASMEGKEKMVHKVCR